jgi:hypothetical protein
VLAQTALLATLALRTMPPALPRFGEGVTRALALLGGGAALLITLRMVLLTIAVVLFLRHPPLPGIEASAWSPTTRLSFATRLRAFDFLGGMPHFALGTQLASAWAAGGSRDRALAEAARDAFEEAADAEPWVSDYSIQYARMLRETGAPLSAREQVLERALAWQPRDPLLYLALAAHRIHAGDVEGAVAVASDRWLPWCLHPPRVGAREHADLLALARLGERHAAAVETCVVFLRSRGREPSDATELIGRFTAR